MGGEEAAVGVGVGVEARQWPHVRCLGNQPMLLGLHWEECDAINLHNSVVRAAARTHWNAAAGCTGDTGERMEGILAGLVWRRIGVW